MVSYKVKKILDLFINITLLINKYKLQQSNQYIRSILSTVALKLDKASIH